MTSVTRHNKELNVTVVANVSDYFVEFNIYEIYFWDLPDESVPMYQVDNTGADFSEQPTQLFLRGSVKWDGCSNWHFDEQIAFHGCSREDLIKLGLILAFCYDLAKELCPNFDDC